MMIRKGFGFEVGQDFSRTSADTAIELAPKEYAKPGYVIGYIAGEPGSSFSFMRRDRVRVHVRKDGLLTGLESV